MIISLNKDTFVVNKDNLIIELNNNIRHFSL